jgi:hypothetical protein
LASFPTLNPDPQVFTPEVMEANRKLLEGATPEFLLGFVSAIDWSLSSFINFQAMSFQGKVPPVYFEKSLLSMVVAAAQKYLEEL